MCQDQGYSDACGILRGTLFLSDQPLSLDDLVERTGYSKSTVCVNMNLLENLGLAKRVVIPRDKRSRYATISDPNSMKAMLLSNIEKKFGSSEMPSILRREIFSPVECRQNALKLK